jgi:glutathione reductase (NADPH)
LRTYRYTCRIADRGVEVIREHGEFVGPSAVRVGDRTVDADHIVIATGSKPRSLPIPGAEHMITSDEVLSARELPNEIVFIGGGVVALEFSHVYARAGAKVMILEALPRLFITIDQEAAERVRAKSERLGITIHTDVRFVICFDHCGAEQVVEAHCVVDGAGSVSNVDSLNLEAGGVDHEGTRIVVEGYLRSTSNQKVIFAGT